MDLEKTNIWVKDLMIEYPFLFSLPKTDVEYYLDYYENDYKNFLIFAEGFNSVIQEFSDTALVNSIDDMGDTKEVKVRSKNEYVCLLEYLFRNDEKYKGVLEKFMNDSSVPLNLLMNIEGLFSEPICLPYETLLKELITISVKVVDVEIVSKN